MVNEQTTALYIELNIGANVTLKIWKTFKTILIFIVSLFYRVKKIQCDYFLLHELLTEKP